jgi:hypothetical protein
MLTFQSFKMDAFEFITKYESYLDEIRAVIKPELQPLIEQLKNIDPHDLVTPETYLTDGSHARGYVWRLFLQKVKEGSSAK